MAKEKKTSEKPKKSWCKRILKCIAWLLVILIALIVAVYLTLGIIVKKAITTAVPPITGTSVNVDDIDLSLLSGHIAINGFNIGNPNGFAKPNIFELGSIVIDFEPKSLLTDKIIIKQVLINKTSADAEINKKGEVNIMILQQNIQNYLNKSAPKPAETKAAAKTSDNGSGKKVIIKKLNIDNSQLHLGVVGQVMTIKLPNIHKTGIGEEKGKSKTVPETIALILSYFSQESVTAIMNSGNQLFMQGLENTKAMLQQGGKMVTDQLNNAAGVAKAGLDSAKNAGTAVTDSVKGVGDSVKSLGNMFK